MVGHEQMHVNVEDVWRHEGRKAAFEYGHVFIRGLRGRRTARLARLMMCDTIHQRLSRFRPTNGEHASPTALRQHSAIR